MQTARLFLIACLCLPALPAGRAHAQAGLPGAPDAASAGTDLPEIAQDIGVDSRVGHVIDMSVSFTDDEGKFVRMKDLFRDGKPVMLSFNYSNCPKLCSVQLQNMVQALGKMKFVPGTDFELVSVSMDPLEQSSRARDTKAKYLTMYDRPETADGWHFLVGDDDAIHYLAEECGFRYKYVKHQKLYSHPPVFILLSPEGKIVRYIHGLDYDPDTVELALVEASEGKIGSPINWLSYNLGCYVFDETAGKYSFQAMFLMRMGGLVTVLALIGTLVPYWFFRKGSRQGVVDKTTSSTSPETWTTA